MADNEIIDAITNEAQVQGVPTEIALAVAEHESSFNQDAVGTSGERGIFQIMPTTATDLEIDPTDLNQNIRGGVKYLKQLNQQTQGNWEDTLTAYNGGIGNLKRDTVSAAARKYSKDVLSLSSKYKSQTEEAKIPQPEEINLEQLPPTAQGFSQALLKSIESPAFEKLPFEDQTQALSKIYNGKKWSKDAYPIFKEVMNNIWDGADPDQLPDIGEIVGPPPISQKDPNRETAQWKQDVIQDLLGKGISPAVFGNRLDTYLNSAAQSEIDAFAIRNRGFFESVASTYGNLTRDVAKGALSGVANPVAGLTRLAGGDKAADFIESIPELLGKPNNAYLYETDETGHLKFDSEGQPIPRYQSQIAQMVGNVGIFLAGGAGLRAGGAAIATIGKTFFAANTLTVGNEIFKDVYEKTGDRTKAYEASLFAIPAAAIGSLGEATVVAKFANPAIGALSSYNKAKYIANVFARNAAVGAVSMAGLNTVEQAGKISQTGEAFKPEEVAVSAIGGAVASGAVSALTSKAPSTKAVRGTLEEQAKIAAALEKFQKEPASTIVLSEEQAAKVPPDILSTLQMDAAPSQEGVVVTKKSSYIPVPESENIAQLDNDIGKLNKSLQFDGTPDDSFGLTDRLSRLKKEHAALEKSIGPVTSGVVKARSTLEAEVSSKRAQLDEQTDPILRKVAYSELQDAKNNLAEFDSANESVYGLPERMTSLQAQIEETQSRLNNARRDTFPNDISQKQANLSRLIKKKKQLVSEIKAKQVEAQEKAATAPKTEGAKPKPPEVQTTAAIVKDETPAFEPEGVEHNGKYVTPVGGKWAVLSKNGEPVSTGHDYYVDAVKSANGVKPKVIEQPQNKVLPELEPEVQTAKKILNPVDTSVGAKKATGLKEETVGQRLRKSETLDSLITEAFGGKDPGLLYSPQTHAESSSLSQEFIQRHGGLPEAVRAYITLPDNAAGAELIFTGKDLVKALNAQVDTFKKAGDSKAAQAAASLAFQAGERASEIARLGGQTVEAAKILQELSPNTYTERVKKVIADNNLSDLTPEQEAKIQKFVTAAQNSGGTVAQNLMAEAQRVAMDATDGKFADGSSFLFSYWQANELSDPSTQAVNIVGNASQLTGSLASYLITGLPRGKVDGVELLKGFVRGALDEGFNAAMLELQGIKTFKPQVTTQEALTGSKFNTRGDFVRDAPLWAKKIGLNNLGYVFRALSAADAFFYKSAQEGMGQLAAYDIATKEGLTGTSRKNRVGELLYNSKEEWNKANLKAKAEIQVAKEAGIKTSKALENLRTWEILEEQRPESIRTESLNFASKNTFNNKPTGNLGSLVEAVNKYANTPFDVPGTRKTIRPLKYIFPFLNVAANIANASLDYTFVGGYRAAFDGNLSNLEKRNALGKFMLGSAMSGIIYGLASEYMDDKDPYFAVYAVGPKNPAQNKLWKEEGGKPYSVKWGDKYFRYAETPLGPLLGFIGALYDTVRYDPAFDKADFPEAIAIGMSGALKSFADNSFLKSIGTVVKAATGDKSVNLEDALISPAKGFIPAVGTGRAISKLVEDPIDTKNRFYSKLVSGIPFVQGIGTRPALNVFGAPVERSFEDRLSFIGRFYSERVTDKATNWLASTGYTLPDFGVTVAGSKGIKNKRAEDLGAAFADVLTPDERYELIEKAGPLIKKRIEQYADTYGEDVYSEKLQEKINQDVKAIRARVKRQIVLGSTE